MTFIYNIYRYNKHVHVRSLEIFNPISNKCSIKLGTIPYQTQVMTHKSKSAAVLENRQLSSSLGKKCHSKDGQCCGITPQKKRNWDSMLSLRIRTVVTVPVKKKSSSSFPVEQIQLPETTLTSAVSAGQSERRIGRARMLEWHGQRGSTESTRRFKPPWPSCSCSVAKQTTSTCKAANPIFSVSAGFN